MWLWVWLLPLSTRFSSCPGCTKYQNITPFYGCRLFRCTDVPPSRHPSIHWWLLGWYFYLSSHSASSPNILFFHCCGRDWGWSQWTWNSSRLHLNPEELLGGKGMGSISRQHEGSVERGSRWTELSQSSVPEASESIRGVNEHTRAWISVRAPLVQGNQPWDRSLVFEQLSHQAATSLSARWLHSLQALPGRWQDTCTRQQEGHWLPGTAPMSGWRPWGPGQWDLRDGDVISPAPYIVGLCRLSGCDPLGWEQPSV